MFQVAFQPDAFARVVPWLMVNHQGLAILIYPETGDEVADHRDNALWINGKPRLDISALASSRRADTIPLQFRKHPAQEG